MVEIAAEKLRKHFGGVHRFGIGLRKVGRSVLVHDALHGARLVAIRTRAFEFFHSRGQSQHEHQMAAGAAAEGADVGRVEVVFRRIGAKKANRGFHVLHRGGELIARREPVIGGCGDVSALGEFDGQRNIAFLSTAAKASAMNEQNRRTRSVRRLARADDVHRLPAADGRVLHVAFGDDSVRDFGGVGGLGKHCAGARQEENRQSGMHQRDYMR